MSMPAGFSGMNVQEVEQFATQLEARATEIENLTAALDTGLTNTSWQGPDALAFRNDWSSNLAPQLRRVATELRTASTMAKRNATEQTTTSAR